MRISDWSSDVCSSDLPVDATIAPASPATVHRGLNGVLEVIPFLQLGDLTVHKERRSAAHPESTPLLEVRLHPLCRRRVSHSGIVGGHVQPELFREAADQVSARLLRLAPPRLGPE